MRLTIVYDDKKGTNEDLIPDHGFSCYIETGTETVLFDTGTDGKILLHNMEVLKKDPEKISKIIISHEHYDHNGGLQALLPLLGPATIYRIGKEPSTDMIQQITVEQPQQITTDIFSTGRLDGYPKDEQSVLLRGSKGFYVLTGCSHPGVKQILQAAKKQENIIGIIGGFHGFDMFDLLKELDHIYPCHCTVHKEKIRKLYPETSHDCFVGATIEI